MKAKETVRDAADREYPEENQMYEYSAFIEGAEWQEERICSDEIINLIRYSLSNAEARRIIKGINVCQCPQCSKTNTI